MTAFIDTNILVYAQSTGRKSDVAKGVIYSGGVISVQVLNEFVNVARHKLKYPWEEISSAVSDLTAVFNPILPIDINTHAKALMLSQAHGFHFYDALIVAAALLYRCDTLITEDLNSGQEIEGLTITNPFLKD